MSPLGVPVMDESPMAKKGRPGKPTGEGRHVRIDADLVSMGRYMASERGVSLTEYMSGILRPVIVKEFREASRRVEGK
jgi:hypothetical protein